jgi:hypothetical protein
MAMYTCEYIVEKAIKRLVVGKAEGSKPHYEQGPETCSKVCDDISYENVSHRDGKTLAWFTLKR